MFSKIFIKGNASHILKFEKKLKLTQNILLSLKGYAKHCLLHIEK